MDEASQGGGDGRFGADDSAADDRYVSVEGQTHQPSVRRRGVCQGILLPFCLSRREEGEVGDPA